MTTPHATPDNEVSVRFIQNARYLITQEYLPKIERCIEQLSDGQVWWRPNSDSNSIGNLMLHIAGNARQWIVCGLGNQPDQRQRQTEFDERREIPRAELLSSLQLTFNEVDQTLAGFEPSRLLDEYPIQGTKTTGLAAIFHVTEHISMHTGQIILLTKMLANMDLLFYDFATGKPVHRWREKKLN
jgi:uncharacterized damage-inducible protein DinB